MIVFNNLTLLTGAFYVGNGWVAGVAGMILLIVIADHSPKFPTFSTSKMKNDEKWMDHGWKNDGQTIESS